MAEINKVTISIDAMGGDFAPEDIVKGSVIGAREHDVSIILVGPETRIKNELARYDTRGLDIEIEHTDEYLFEGEPAAYALRLKRRASIALATRLVKDGKAQAVVGVGPTGGVVVSALTYLGTIEGISRPVIGGNFCGLTPNVVLMDMGGNIDARPDQYLDFAIIGTVYVRSLLGIANPTIGLVSVGKEEGKGNAVTKEAFSLLEKSGLNFIGNIEGNDIADAKANVIVCDGFVGNAIAKYSEGLGTSISHWLTGELAGHLPEENLKLLTSKLLKLTVPADSNGGGPVWGVNGVVFKAHGRSRYPEVARTIENVKKVVQMDIVKMIKDELSKVKSKMKVIDV